MPNLTPGVWIYVVSPGVREEEEEEEEELMVLYDVLDPDTI